MGLVTGSIILGLTLMIKWLMIRAELTSDEIRENWSSMRQSLSATHHRLGKDSGHEINTLNKTAGDHMLHRTPSHSAQNPIFQNSGLGVFPIMTINMTNPSPLTVPVRDIADVFLFGSNVTLPTMIPMQVTFTCSS